MDIKPIKTERDYNQAIERLEIIFNATSGSPEGDELEVSWFIQVTGLLRLSPSWVLTPYHIFRVIK